MGEIHIPIAGALNPGAAEEAANKTREAIIELQSAVFDRAAAYTNLITLGGYAGGFTLWAYTRDQLGPTATIAVALLFGISLATFVFFEVYKMVVTQQSTIKQVRLATEALPPDEFLRRLVVLQQEARRTLLTTLLRIWTVVMFICVGTGLLAVGTLFYNFFAILLFPAA